MSSIFLIQKKKNLISLSLLDSKNCKIIIEPSDISVSHGALILMGGRKNGSLYVLQGSIMTDIATIPLTITELEFTRLQYKKFESFRLDSGSTIKSLSVFKFKRRFGHGEYPAKVQIGCRQVRKKRYKKIRVNVEICGLCHVFSN